jgi:hypothetical protein
MHIDARAVIKVGTALWFLAAAGFACSWPALSPDHRIWLWTCLVAGALGLAGLLLMRKHRGEGRL